MFAITKRGIGALAAAIMGGTAMRTPAPSRMWPTNLVWPTNHSKRGKARPAGSKLARKAAKGTIGVKSGPNSLRPRMPNRFPFSAKR